MVDLAPIAAHAMPATVMSQLDVLYSWYWIREHLLQCVSRIQLVALLGSE